MSVGQAVAFPSPRQRAAGWAAEAGGAHPDALREAPATIAHLAVAVIK